MTNILKVCFIVASVMFLIGMSNIVPAVVAPTPTSGCVRPESFGATGTGVAHDDAPAFQAAENSIENSQGSDVHLCLSNVAYGIGSSIIVTPGAAYKVIWKGAGSSGGTRLLGLASFTGSAVIQLHAAAANASASDWDMGGFSIVPQTVGMGPTAGISVGDSSSQTLQGGLHQSVFRDIQIRDFSYDWLIRNARLINFQQVSGWENSLTNGVALSIGDIGSSSSFTGDLDFNQGQFVANSTGAQALSLGSNTASATVAGVRFHGTIFYTGSINLIGTNGGFIADIWFDGGWQFDQSGPTANIQIGSADSDTIVTDIHLTDGYMVANGAANAVPYVNIFSTTAGRTNAIWVQHCYFAGAQLGTGNAGIASSNVPGTHIIDNNFKDTSATGGAGLIAIQGASGAEVRGNMAQNFSTARGFPYMVLARWGEDYYVIRDNISNGIATAGTGENANVSNGAAGVHATIDGNW